MMHQGALNDIGHRLRVGTHTATAYLDQLDAEKITDADRHDLVCDLRKYLMLVTECADQFAPIHSLPGDMPAENVIEMAVWPRAIPVRLAVPPIQAIEGEWR